MAKRRKKKTKKQRMFENANAAYVDKVRALRQINRGFGAADGFNLRDVKRGQIPAALKRKITRYAKGQAAELAAIATGRALIKRPRRADVLETAITASQQLERFKGQKAVVFVTDFPEDFKVILRPKRKRRGATVRVVERGQERRSVRFEEIYQETWEEELLNDPVEVAIQALAQFPQTFQRFRVMTGKYSSRQLMDRLQVQEFINAAMSKYGDDAGEWLTGIVGIS